jgi:uncharacterized membrane-anchored protein YhcB (DUF1043 family)
MSKTAGFFINDYNQLHHYSCTTELVHTSINDYNCTTVHLCLKVQLFLRNEQLKNNVWDALWDSRIRT